MIDVAELTTVEARKRFSDFLNRVSIRKEWIRLTRRGKPVAGAVPLEQFEYFEGPEDSPGTQGMQTFDDIMTRGERVRAERIGESPAVYEVGGALHRVTSAELRNNLSDVLNRVGYGNQRIIVTRREWDLFALVPPHVFDKYLEIDDLEDELDARTADEAMREAALVGTVPLDELLERYGID